MDKKIILGIAGEMASGKGTVAKYLTEKHSAVGLRFSTVLRDVLDRLGIEQSRENMQMVSTSLRQSFGDDLLAKVMKGDALKTEAELIVIDGVRREPDIKYLRELPEFKLVYIEADMEKRHERIVKRGENTDDINKTFEEFKKDHEREAEVRIKDLKAKADFVIDNNGFFEEFYRQIDEIIKKRG